MKTPTERLNYTPEQLQELNFDIVEILPDAVVVVNDSGQIVFFNNRAEVLFGYNRREVIGNNVEMLIPEAMRARHIPFRENYLADPTTREMGAGRALHALDSRSKEFHVNIHLATRVVAGIGKHTVAVIRRTKLPDIPAAPPPPPFGSRKPEE